MDATPYAIAAHVIKSGPFLMVDIDTKPSWRHQEELLCKLWLADRSIELIAYELGRTEMAILCHASRMGLPKRHTAGRPKIHTVKLSEPSKKLRKPMQSPRRYVRQGHKVEMSVRTCLRCLNAFQSSGIHNRMCSPCKGVNVYE